MISGTRRLFQTASGCGLFAPNLVATEDDRAEVHTALLTALPTADPKLLSYLVEGLLTLGPTEEDRAETRTALLTALPTADQDRLSLLVADLRSVSPIESWRAWLANLG